ncbi:unnamed protein product [Caenorhabditis nigoni]
MSVTGEKKFLLKHVFKNLKNAGLTSSGDIKEHFGIPWKLHVLYGNTLYLECLHSEKINSWFLEVDLELRLGNQKDVKLKEKTIKFASSNLTKIVFEMENDLDKYLIDGNLIVELVVKINKSMGIREHLDFGKNNKADVILIAGDRKFYVNRMHLSYHSSYFKTLLLGKLSESEKSIIELKNIDPDDLQKFLNLLYGESEINDDTVEGILKLSDIPGILQKIDGYKLALIFIPCLIFFVLWFEFVYWGMANTVEKQEYMREELKFYYDEDSSNIPFIAPMYWSIGKNGEKIWKFWECMSSVGCVVIISICFSTILYCAFNIYWSMKSAQPHMSAKTIELNRQLFITLTFQTLLPFIMMYSPVGLIITLPLFEVYAGKLANFVAASVAVYPSLEPLIAIFCIKEFRKTVFCRKRQKITSCTTITQSTAVSSMAPNHHLNF